MSAVVECVVFPSPVPRRRHVSEGASSTARWLLVALAAWQRCHGANCGCRVAERSPSLCCVMQVVIVDCYGHLLGRLASIIAKELLNGQRVVRAANSAARREQRDNAATTAAAKPTCNQRRSSALARQQSDTAALCRCRRGGAIGAVGVEQAIWVALQSPSIVR